MTKKLDQELAYSKLLKLAIEMHEGLQLAHHTENLAGKWKEKVEANTQCLINSFAELKPTLPYAGVDVSHVYRVCDKHLMAISFDDKTVFEYKVMKPKSEHPFDSTEFTFSVSKNPSMQGGQLGQISLIRSLKGFLENEWMFDSLLMTDDNVINRQTGEVGVVNAASRSVVSVSTRNNIYSLSPQETFAKYRVPRIEEELSTLRNTYEAESGKTHKARPSTAAPGNDAPAP